MAESYIGVTEAGTPDAKLHSFDRTIGANTVEDEIVLLGEQYLASYLVQFTGISVATGADHVIQIMAGASNKLRIRRIRIQQHALATAVGRLRIEVRRLSSAGTGGTAVTPDPFDPGDAASGATARTLPTAKGTEGVGLIQFNLAMRAAEPVALELYEWTQLPNQKPLIVAAGTSNGIALKVADAVAGASVTGTIEFDESSF